MSVLLLTVSSWNLKKGRVFMCYLQSSLLPCTTPYTTHKEHFAPANSQDISFVLMHLYKLQ